MDDARIEDLRAMHFVAESKAYPFCYECDQAWPCGTAHLIAALEASRAECARLRGVPEERQPLAASADLPDLRPCRLLRLVEEQARNQALSRNRTPDYAVVRAG